ncbi:VWA domain-containing protein [Corynebacterium sp. NML180780]|uniref:VWA domain-containing protein n=1 Tax=Corynebacterium sp. NML180780 TaxID=2598459 RepID=UPI00118F6131|nr:VWA domain-containing protein [Corynebacterium sp. NML180780]TVX76073.1 VWA domain-containing protein [Corynebacterium sp. NML180780]
MRHTTARVRLERSVRALLAAVLVMAIGVAPAGAAETSAPAAPEIETAAQTSEQPTAEASAEATTSQSSTPSSSAPVDPSALVPGAVTQDGVTVERSGDVDTIHVHDSEGELWQWGGKASMENIFALTRKGEVTEVLSVTADGRKLDRNKFGWVNSKDGAFIGFDLNALHRIPPVDVTIEVKADAKGDYEIAESEDIPTAKEFSKTGYDPKEELDPEVEAQLRAAPVATVPGWPDTELKVENLGTNWVGGNPELTFNVNGTADAYLLTRFAIKKTKNDSNTKNVEGPVTISIYRDGKEIEKRSLNFTTVGTNENSKVLNQRFWNKNALGNSYDTEFRLVPEVTDLKLQRGDTVKMNVIGPPNGQYAVQVWGQEAKLAKTFNIVGENGIKISPTTTSGDSSAYTSTAQLGERINFEKATVRVNAPNSVLAWEQYRFDVSLIESGVTLGRKLVAQTPEYVEFEVFPMKDGKRLPEGETVLVESGAALTLRTSFTDDPENIDAKVTIQGTPVRSQDDVKPVTRPEGEEWLHPRVPNPPLPQKCGLRIAIVADRSTSLTFGDVNGFEASRKAAKSLVSSLGGTASQVGVFNFARQGSANTSGPISLNTADGVDKVNAAIDQWTTNVTGGSTNWEDGLKQAQGGGYDVVYFITDGMPTWDNAGWQKIGDKNAGAFVQERSLNRAIDAANELKKNGTRVVPIMVDLKTRDGATITQDFVLKNVTWDTNPYYIYLDKPKNVNVDSAVYNTNAEDLYVNSQKAWELRVLKAKDNSYRGKGDITNSLEEWTYGVRGVTKMGEDISGPGDTLRVKAYSQLDAEMKKLGASLNSLCEGELIVTKRIVDANGQITDATASGWDFTATAQNPVLKPGRRVVSTSVSASDRVGVAESKLTTSGKDEDKGTVAWRTFSGERSEFAVRETQKGGYSLRPQGGKNATCYQEIGLPGEAGYFKTDAEVVNDGSDGFKVISEPYASVHCVVDNTQEDAPLLSLNLQKVDADNTAMDLSGAAFTLGWDGDSGQPNAIDVKEDAEAKRYITDAVLVPNRIYTLSETKSPKAADGTQYALLVKPIRLRVVPESSDGQPSKVEFETNGEWTTDASAAGVWAKREDNTVYVQLANVRQGNLPKTGGHGLQAPLAVSTVLMLLGAALARRRAVQV